MRDGFNARTRGRKAAGRQRMGLKNLNMSKQRQRRKCSRVLTQGREDAKAQPKKHFKEGNEDWSDFARDAECSGMAHRLLCVVASSRLCVELLTSMQGGLDSGDADGAAFWEIVFANPDDPPAAFSQHSVHLPVPELVGPHFNLPISPRI